MINDREAQLRTRLKEDFEYYDVDSAVPIEIKHAPDRGKEPRVSKGTRVRRASKFDMVSYV